MSHDRLPDNRIQMIRELIANMLGVRREGVTHAAARLQEQGLIQYGRGLIRILDREKLMDKSCESYEVVKSEADLLQLES